MEQIAQYMAGERDYTKIKGGTGPLVYPAAHVYTYAALYQVTDNGTNILRAQYIFAALYMVTLAVVMTCYWQAKVHEQSKRIKGIRHNVLTLRPRSLPTSFHFLLPPRDSTVSLFCAVSTTALPSSSSF
jgi:hypothetical protein